MHKIFDFQILREFPKYVSLFFASTCGFVLCYRCFDGSAVANGILCYYLLHKTWFLGEEVHVSNQASTHWEGNWRSWSQEVCWDEEDDKCLVMAPHLSSRGTSHLLVFWFSAMLPTLSMCRPSEFRWFRKNQTEPVCTFCYDFLLIFQIRIIGNLHH